MASYGFDGETVKTAKLGPKGKGRKPKTKYKRRGPGPKSPLVPVNRAEQLAGAIKKRGNSAAAPGQRKKALGLKSARSLAPGRAGKPSMPRAGNPMPGGAGKAAAIAARAKRQSPGKAAKLGRGPMPQVSAPEVPRPGLLDKIASAKGRRRQPPAKAGPRRRANIAGL